MLYKCLAKDRRTDFARNIFHFISTQLNRRFVQHNRKNNTYEVLDDARVMGNKISAAIRDDKILRAANRSNPLWVLGVHDPSGAHNDQPFVHLQEDGETWVRINSQQVQELLAERSDTTSTLCRLLVLPANVSLGTPPPPRFTPVDEMVADAVASSSSSSSPNDGQGTLVLEHIAKELNYGNADELRRALATLQVRQIPSDIVVRCDNNEEDASMAAVSTEDETVLTAVASNQRGHAPPLRTSSRPKKRVRYGEYYEPEEEDAVLEPPTPVILPPPQQQLSSVIEPTPLEAFSANWGSTELLEENMQIFFEV